MATGESFRSLSYSFRIPRCTISLIVHETAKIIYDCLKEEFLPVPRSEESWTQIAKDFWNDWQFPNCLGAIDGKHVEIVQPVDSGSTFYNYKGFFSIVLMGLANSTYEFSYVGIGCNGRVSDGGVWSTSDLRTAIENNKLQIPGPKQLPNSNKVTPLVLIGDEAFGLKPYLMRPFPGKFLTKEERIYNYSRARRVIENKFGILANRWRFLLVKIMFEAERVEVLVLAACALHNMLSRRKSTNQNYISEGLVDKELENGRVIPGSWRSDYSGGVYRRPQMSGNRGSSNSKEIQQVFKSYFITEGAVPWKENSI